MSVNVSTMLIVNEFLRQIIRQLMSTKCQEVRLKVE
jgi:hypothetical protein